MWLVLRVDLNGYGTQIWLEETVMVVKYTWVAISEMLSMVKRACMDKLNAWSFINRCTCTPVEDSQFQKGASGPDHGPMSMEFPFQVTGELTRL